MFGSVILFLHFLGAQRQQEHEDDENKQETKNDEEIGRQEKTIKQWKWEWRRLCGWSMPEGIF